MGRTERLCKMERLLQSKGQFRRREVLDQCEISRATFTRDLEYLRERLNTPVDYDFAKRAYVVGVAEGDAPRYPLPNLWFTGAEIAALLTFYHFLEDLQPGILSQHIQPLKNRIESLLESRDQTIPEITRRIRILSHAIRRTDPESFQLVAHALLTRNRLRFDYDGRERGETTARIVSPQRLTHYRENWYLDAWDHGKRGIRTFAVERIREPRQLKEPAKNVAEQRLNRHLAESYGIFSGKPGHKALLRFSPKRARWVADERWHPQQKGWSENGYYFLEIPYSDDRELVLDILKHGPDVEVLRPKSLRDKVLAQLLQAVTLYRKIV